MQLFWITVADRPTCVSLSSKALCNATVVDMHVCQTNKVLLSCPHAQYIIVQIERVYESTNRKNIKITIKCKK